jgi:hypothetical protein
MEQSSCPEHFRNQYWPNGNWHSIQQSRMITDAGFSWASFFLAGSSWRQTNSAGVAFKVRGFQVETKFFGKNPGWMVVRRLHTGIDFCRRCVSIRSVARRFQCEGCQFEEICDSDSEESQSEHISSSEIAFFVDEHKIGGRVPQRTDQTKLAEEQTQDNRTRSAEN